MSQNAEGRIPGVQPATSLIQAARRTSTWEKHGRLVLGAVGVVVFLLVWEIVARLELVNPDALPPATLVISRLFVNLAFVEYWQAIGATMWAWFLGVLISTAGGILVGLLIGSTKIGRAFTHSTVELLRPIPSVGLIPLAALIFGVSLGSELFIICYGCFWLVLIQVMYGIADVDKVASDTVATFRMNWWERIRYLTFPTLLPYLVTGLRLAATVALIIAISAEMIIGTPGIGREVNLARINGVPEVMVSFIITSGVLGILINLLFRFVERKLLFWHSSVRGTVAS